MTEAYPRFTPVQILEAGERAMAEGRAEYASQFFQHLIDHYAATPEAASARDAMARLGYDDQPTASRTTQQKAAPQPYQPAATPYPEAGISAAASAPNSGSAPAFPSNRRVNGTGETMPHHTYPANGARPNGNAAGNFEASSRSQHADGLAATRSERGFGAAPGALPNQTGVPGATGDLPRHIARQSQPPVDYNGSVRGAAVRPAPAQRRTITPSPEKHYIIGRVIAGLSLLIGISGIFAGIVLVYAAVTDPAIFSTFGFAKPGQAIMLAVSVFVGSAILMIISQIATAIFNAADATTDLARLERYRAGDTEEVD